MRPGSIPEPVAFAGAPPGAADRAAALFEDFTLEVFEDRHHFDPPHRVEPKRLADSLAGTWMRAG